jgi:AcrR family transcriptional regulator
LNEQSSARPRSYRKTKRAEDESHTKARIVEAAETLHATVGPARTSVSAVAQRAGVTRATVYRHFPDDESLFLACSSHWLSRQRLPDPEGWAGQDPLARLHAGLTDIYRYYREGEPMITRIHRDAEAVPPRVAANRLAMEQRWLAALLQQPLQNLRRGIVRAAVAHAAAFSTWRSLCVTLGLSDRSAVDLMVGMVAEASRSKRTAG